MTDECRDANYTEDQLAILRGRRLDQITNPLEKLAFANAAAPTPKKKAPSEDPRDATYRLSGDYDSMITAQLDPVRRLQMVEAIGLVSSERANRKANAPKMTDDEYVQEMMTILPFLSAESKTIVNRIISYYGRSY